MISGDPEDTVERGLAGNPRSYRGRTRKIGMSGVPEALPVISRSGGASQVRGTRIDGCRARAAAVEKASKGEPWQRP